MSTAMRDLFRPTKLNVGALGNVVTQLHFHVIARFASDAAWPGPAWGTAPERYRPDEIDRSGAAALLPRRERLMTRPPAPATEPSAGDVLQHAERLRQLVLGWPVSRSSAAIRLVIAGTSCASVALACSGESPSFCAITFTIGLPSACST